MTPLLQLGAALIEASFFPSPEVFAVCCAVVLLAEAVKVLLGFGAGLIAVGLMALVLPELQDAVVLLLLITLPGELFVVASCRRQIRWRGVALVLVGLAGGIPLGTAALRLGDPQIVLIGLGAFLVAVGLLFALLPLGLHLSLHPLWGTFAGFLGGTLSGMFGTGGPPLILFYRLAGLPKAAFRGQLMAVFLATTAVRLPTYIAGGLVTPPRLWAALAVAPVVLAGIVVGHRVQLRLDERTFQRLVALALALLGVLLLLR